MANRIDQYYLGTAGSESMLSANDADIAQASENNSKDIRLQGTNRLVRYKIPVMYKWKFKYKYIYGHSFQQYDKGLGRNDLFTLYQADNEMSFLVPTDTGGLASYTVRFTLGSWNEQLIHRSGDFFTWGLSFELVQTI